MAEPRWKVESMRFRFQLGENQFYARHFDVAVGTTHFLDIEGDPDQLTLPIAEYGERVSAYVFLSHPVDRELPVLRSMGNVVRFASHQYRRGYVEVESTFDAYLARLSSNKRSQLKRKLKKFREHSGGTIDFRIYRTPAELETFHPLARKVSEKTYQEKLFKKGLPTSPAFLDDMRERATSPTPRVRGYLLFDQGAPIAYLYATIDGGCLTYDYVGFDPSAKDWSPGNVLQAQILENVFAEKLCRIFDFGEGESQYKDFFATASTRCADLYYFPKTPAGYALVGSQAGLFYLSRGIVRTLDRFGLKQRIKQILRGNFRKPAGAPNGATGASDAGGGASAPEESA
jgi:CelD/BcsL family acetyltransferase involved in cellulose biosynthesis